jgi:hypothetical protein
VLNPRFRELAPPVIVIGMHRSGTSLVAAMLAILGVYMGPEMRRVVQPDGAVDPDAKARESGYAEAEAFRLLNERLLQRAGAAWNRPEPFLQRRNDPPFAAACLRRIELASFGSLHTGYLNEMPRAEGGWGWKDPRTSLTLPYWLKLFPEAWVVHVRRDPNAVADSLQRRARSWQAAAPAPLSTAQRLRWAAAHPTAALGIVLRRAGMLPTPPADADPCLDRDYCLGLIDTYVRECEAYRDRAGYVELCFEEVLAAPEPAVRRLAALLPAPADDSRIARAAGMTRRDRAA